MRGTKLMVALALIVLALAAERWLAVNGRFEASLASSSAKGAAAKRKPPALSGSETVTPAGIPVLKPKDGDRKNLTINVAQNLEAEIAKKSDWLLPYRIPGQPTLPGAERYELLKLRAVPLSRYQPAMGAKVSEKFGMAIFAANLAHFDLTLADSFPVLAAKSGGMLGLVTGTIIVTLREAGLAQALARDYGLSLRFIDRDLRVAYLAAPSHTPLEPLLEALSRDRSVERVDLEVAQTRKRL